MDDFVSEQRVVVEWRGHLLLIGLNRPDKRNAMSDAMRAEFTEALEHIAADKAIRALVLTGAEGAPVLSTYAYQQWADQGSDATAAAAACVLAALCTAFFVPLLRRRVVA